MSWYVRWGLHGPSKCWCCENPEQETLSRVFLKSSTANRTWSYFCSFTGLNMTGRQLREVIMLWWGSKVNKEKRPCYRAMPSFIIWELWRRRNRKKHEGKDTSVSRIIHNVTRHVQMLIQVRKPHLTCLDIWPEILNFLEKDVPKVKWTKVLWEFPPEGWIKYSTDGASRGNPGLSSYAYCLRDEKGDLLFAKCDIIDNTYNIVAEARAILEACKHSKQAQHNQVIIQTDSMLMLKILEDKWAVPWSIAGMVAEIKASMHQKHHLFQHILREGNQLADYLANRAIDKGGCRFTNFSSMDVAGRKIINSDKLESPYLRISPEKG